MTVRTATPQESRAPCGASVVKLVATTLGRKTLAPRHSRTDLVVSFRLIATRFAPSLAVAMAHHEYD